MNDQNIIKKSFIYLIIKQNESIKCTQIHIISFSLDMKIYIYIIIVQNKFAFV